MTGATSPSNLTRVILGSIYSHQLFPSDDRGMSRPFHRHDRCIHTHATVLGVCSKQNVVNSRLSEVKETREEERSGRRQRGRGRREGEREGNG